MNFHMHPLVLWAKLIGTVAAIVFALVSSNGPEWHTWPDTLSRPTPLGGDEIGTTPREPSLIGHMKQMHGAVVTTMPLCTSASTSAITITSTSGTSYPVSTTACYAGPIR